MATQVFLHVGLPKTGTSYLQAILWANREALKADHLLLLPGTRRSQLHAAIDVLGSAERAHFPPRVKGSWRALVEEIHAWPGRSLVSRENLCLASEHQIGQVVGDLAPAEVHVVITVRDLARAIPAHWQQHVKVGRRYDLDSFVQSIIDAPDETGHFQRTRCPELVAARWAEHVPADRIHVVTLPPPGSAPETLWRRFSGVLGIDGPLGESTPVNPSLGVVETELLRRTNVSLTPRLRERQTSYWTKVVLANNILGRRDGEAFGLPAHAHGWTVQRAERSVRELRAGGYDVHGDLDDLLPAAAGSRRRVPAEVSDAELVEVATETIAELVVQLRDAKLAERRARARRRARRARARADAQVGRGRRRAGRAAAPPTRRHRVARRLRRKRR